MPIPNLIHPVPITISQIDKAETEYDNDYREPIQRVARDDEKIVPGQMAWAMDRKVEYTRGGNKYEADGYVLFRYVDLNAKAVSLAINDRFKSFGGIPTNTYIRHLQPMGHYPDTQGPTLVKAYFGDKDPAKQS